MMNLLFHHRVQGDQAYHDPPERQRHVNILQTEMQLSPVWFCSCETVIYRNLVGEESQHEICTWKENIQYRRQGGKREEKSRTQSLPSDPAVPLAQEVQEDPEHKETREEI